MSALAGAAAVSSPAVKQELPNPPNVQPKAAPAVPKQAMPTAVSMPVRIQNKFVQPRPTFVAAMNLSNQMKMQQQMKQQQMHQQQAQQQQTTMTQPPRPPSLNTRTPTAEDLKISIKQSLVPTQSPARAKLYNQMNNNMVRFVANNAFSQYIQNRKSAQNILADALQSNTNTKTNSYDRKHSEESSDDSFVYGSRNGKVKSERHAPNVQVIPQKRLFSSISNPQSTRAMPLNGQYPQLGAMSNYSRFAVNAALAASANPNGSASNSTTSAAGNNQKKKLNVNVWCWKSADVVEWLLTHDIGKLYLVNFARSDVNGLKLTLLTEDSLQQLGVNVAEHRKYLLSQIALLIKQQNEHNQHIPFRCLYCNVYSPSRVVILQHINTKHGVKLPVVIGDDNTNGSKSSNGSPTGSGDRSGDRSGAMSGDHDNLQNPSIKVQPKMNRETTKNYAQYWDDKLGRWQCSMCNSSFAQRSTLRSHLSKKHSIHIPHLRHGRPNKDHKSGRGNVEDRRCPFCNKVYSTRYYCERHRENCKQRRGRSLHDVNAQNDDDVDMDDQGETRESSSFSDSYSDSNSIDSDTDVTDMSDRENSPRNSQRDSPRNRNGAASQQKFECTQCGVACDSGLDLLCHVAQHEDTPIPVIDTAPDTADAVPAQDAGNVNSTNQVSQATSSL